MHQDRPSFTEGTAITRAEALAAGWTDDAIRHAIASERWTRVRPGRYMVGAEPATLFVLAEATHRATADSAISHSMAAAFYGLPLLRSPRLCLTVPPARNLTTLHDAHLHRARLDDHVTTVGTNELTIPSRTVLDVARERGRRDGLVAADSALHLGLADQAALQDVLDACAGWPFARRAVWVAERCDGRAESPLESLSRIELAERSVPTPEPQTVIGDAGGRFVARVDFYWDEQGVVGEADGMVKYNDHDDLLAEKRRQERLERLGLTVVRWTWADLRRFDATAARVNRALSRPARHRPPREWTILTPGSVRGFGAT